RAAAIRATFAARPTTTTTTTVAPATTTTTFPPAPAQAGCPPPPPPPPSTTPPWHPAVLVPDAALPALAAPRQWASATAATRGKGMWVWEWRHTEAGDAAAVVAKAAAARLDQLWVRVGDSPNGFYGAAELAALVPAAHAAHIAVIGWGFPY